MVAVKPESRFERKSRSRVGMKALPRGSSQDSDLQDTLQAPAQSCCFPLIIRPDLPSRSRSSSRLPIGRERTLDRKAFRRESRQTKKCLYGDPLPGRVNCRATCILPSPLPRQDRYQRGELEYLSALGHHRLASAWPNQNRGSSLDHRW